MGPNDCWWAWLVMVVQSMIGLLMDAVMIGVIFARISHPKCALFYAPCAVTQSCTAGVIFARISHPQCAPPAAVPGGGSTGWGQGS